MVGSVQWGGRERTQRCQEGLAVVVDWAYPHVAEHLGHDALHHLAVCEHVGDAARHAQVVFEDRELAAGKAHQVAAGDGDVIAARHADALHFAAIVAAGVDQFARHDAIAQDRGFVIQVFEEEVEREDALNEPTLDSGPFGAADHAGHQVVGKNTLDAFLAPVDGERDALVEEREVGGLLAGAQLVARERADALEERAVALARRRAGREHLVVGAGVECVVAKRLGGRRAGFATERIGDVT